MRGFVLIMAAACCIGGTTSARGQGVTKSRSAGFFVGAGFEGNGITTEPNSGGSISESGSGGGLVLGYGFSRRWSLFVEGSSAVINADGGGTYGLAHFDIGARVHFRSGSNVVVPFLQFGVAGLAEGQTVTSASGSQDVTATGGGLVFGGGMNAHFNPAFAFSTSLTWAAGSFNNFQIDHSAVAFPSVNATSARLHLGLVWFPKAEAR